MTAMYKHVGLVTKRPEISYEEFVAYWRGAHADFAKGLPGLRKYVINPIDKRLYPDSPVDGFSELWFDSEEDAEAAWVSDAGKATHADGTEFFHSMAITNLHQIDVI
ncbi:EthD family reductase [Aeromicrobium sp. IC_218]|uniref:EthD family reductase n=1 Tax=Aeromicrobium sp. IC_218 TaxID=2545468 RepID=UPI001038E2EC|nr:EthD family reductase [Aeromicrobium sp. IC_218]TCI96347.1 EthD family reductase [Aeromicrobium sp. IC_218]